MHHCLLLFTMDFPPYPTSSKRTTTHFRTWRRSRSSLRTKAQRHTCLRWKISRAGCFQLIFWTVETMMTCMDPMLGWCFEQIIINVMFPCSKKIMFQKWHFNDDLTQRSSLKQWWSFGSKDEISKVFETWISNVSLWMIFGDMRMGENSENVLFQYLVHQPVFLVYSSAAKF